MELLTVPLDELVEDPNNARAHPRENIDAIKVSLTRFGQVLPILVRDSDSQVVAGNGTLQAMRELDWVECQVALYSGGDNECKALAIALNQTGATSVWDEGTLARTLGELQGQGFDLGCLGFDSRGLDAACAGFGSRMVQFEASERKAVIEDDPPEPPKIPVTRMGDVWTLGDHRLACGDCTEGRFWEPVEMLFTDPPYGVGYSGGHFHSGDVTIKRDRELLAGDDTTDAYGQFLPLVRQFVDGPCYMFFAGTLGDKVLPQVVSAGLVIHSLIIWHKINATYAAMNAQYKQRHEPLLYFKPPKSSLRWCGPSDECTVWEESRDGRNIYHPTQKPVCLAARALRNHTAQSVMDPFAGSGSTFIAAEQLERRCFGVEISPAYCDVIVERWQNLSGGKASRA
jgi:DNA modification methylase